MTAIAELVPTLTAAGIDTITDRRSQGVLVLPIGASSARVTCNGDAFAQARKLSAQIGDVLEGAGFRTARDSEYTLIVTGIVSCVNCSTAMTEDEALPCSGGSYACTERCRAVVD